MKGLIFGISLIIGVIAIILCDFYYKILSFLLPLILFLIGFGLGYFIKNFKSSLILGGVTGVIGTIIAFVLNFFIYNLAFSEEFEFIFYSIVGAMGLFFGFGFGSIAYLRIKRKKERIEKFEKIMKKGKK